MGTFPWKLRVFADDNAAFFNQDAERPKLHSHAEHGNDHLFQGSIIVERRSGDIACCYADPALAKETLGWSAELGIDRMCQDSWRWQSMNPAGY